MKTLSSFIFVAMTVAGLVSSLPVPEESTTSVDHAQDSSNVPVNMVVFHFPGSSENAPTPGDVDKKAVANSKIQEHPLNSSSNKQGGFSVMSSSRSSNFAVVTPLQARSETPEDSNLIKRKVGLDNEGQMMKRAFTITISPILRQTTGLIRNSSVGKGFKSYVAKPVTSVWNFAAERRKENLRQYKLEQRWARYDFHPHQSQGWNGHEHFYGNQMRQDYWD